MLNHETKECPQCEGVGMGAVGKPRPFLEWWEEAQFDYHQETCSRYNGTGRVEWGVKDVKP